MKKGYHYCSLGNWMKIQEEGLVPYRIDNHPELNQYFKNGPEGIWVWPFMPDGMAHFGNIIWQVYTKGDYTVTMLEVEYDLEHRLTYNGKLVDVEHDGAIGLFQYHRQEPGVIYTKPIPPEKIKEVKTFNMVEILSIDKDKPK